MPIRFFLVFLVAVISNSVFGQSLSNASENQLQELREQYIQLNNSYRISGTRLQYAKQGTNPIIGVSVNQYLPIRPVPSANIEAQLKFSERYVAYMIYPPNASLNGCMGTSLQHVGNNIFIYPNDPTKGLARSLIGTGLSMFSGSPFGYSPFLR